MNKIIWLISGVCICLYLSGCSGWIVRSSTSQKARVDQEISGNRGFVSGKPTSPPKTPSFTERKVYKIEIELPEFKSRSERKAKKQSRVRTKRDQTIWGNRGYVLSGGAIQDEFFKEIPEQGSPKDYSFDQAPQEVGKMIKQQMREKGITSKTKPVRVKSTKVKPAGVKPAKVLSTYKVKKGDTLQKISRKFYGTTKKWPLLYRANKDTLKTPNKVYPGQILDIPEIK